MPHGPQHQTPPHSASMAMSDEADAPPGYLHEGSDWASVLSVAGAVVVGSGMWVGFFMAIGVL